MSGWRLAKSLVRFREQVDLRWPDRRKDNDGTIGDTAHSARTSDHNPNELGVVCAIDITNDPEHGLLSENLAETLRLSGDARIKYIISNKKISNPLIEGGKWRPYSGANPHDHHMHLSVSARPSLYDDMGDWPIVKTPTPTLPEASHYVVPPPTLRRGDIGESVEALKKFLAVKLVSAGFDEIVEAQVRVFQRQQGLHVDGVVGPQTWTALKA